MFCKMKLSSKAEIEFELKIGQSIVLQGHTYELFCSHSVNQVNIHII